MSTTTIGQPSSSAYRFVLEDMSTGALFDAYCDLVNWIGDQWGIDVRYRTAGSSEGSKWIWLVGPDIIDANITTPEDTDAEVDRIMGIINKKVEEVFGEQDSDDIPDHGLERIRYILKHVLKEHNNVLFREKKT